MYEDMKLRSEDSSPKRLSSTRTVMWIYLYHSRTNATNQLHVLQVHLPWLYHLVCAVFELSVFYIFALLQLLI